MHRLWTCLSVGERWATDCSPGLWQADLKREMVSVTRVHILKIKTQLSPLRDGRERLPVGRHRRDTRWAG